MVRQKIGNVKDLKYPVDIKNAYNNKKKYYTHCQYAKFSKSYILISNSFLYC